MEIHCMGAHRAPVGPQNLPCHCGLPRNLPDKVADSGSEAGMTVNFILRLYLAPLTVQAM